MRGNRQGRDFLAWKWKEIAEEKESNADGLGLILNCNRKEGKGRTDKN